MNWYHVLMIALLSGHISAIIMVCVHSSTKFVAIHGLYTASYASVALPIE